MRFLKSIVLGLTVLAFPMLAEAQPAREPSNVSRSDEYTRSIGPRRAWAVTSATAETLYVIPTSSATTTPQIWEWGAQAYVTCTDRKAENAHRNGALACWLSDTAATVELGNYESVDGTAANRLYLCDTGGNGCGYITDPDGTDDGPGPCLWVPAGGGMYLINDRVAQLDNSFRGPTSRLKSCRGATLNPKVHNGRPCDANGECLGGATCVATSPPDGAFLSFTMTSTTVTCQATEAR